MGNRVLAGLALALMTAGSAAAAVASTSPSGFIVKLEGDIAQLPDAAYARFLAIGAWWSSDHTFSGDAANITIEAEPGGCWCEAMPGGGVKHMEVAMVDPGRMLVFRGGLGPLLFMGASGSMTVRFEPKGEGTHVVLTYAVGGHDPAGWSELASAVDGVLTQQMANYLKLP